LPEHFLNTFLRYTWAVVFDNKLDDVFLWIYFIDFDAYAGQNPSLFTCVKGVIDGFFDCSDKGTCKGVKTEKVLILLKKLGNGDLLLL